MATLKRLQISGIRSFGPYEDNVAQIIFTTPLTLILGQNGCGKTTIIEAIRYACTGDLPAGTTSGQGFVNDPQMTQSSSTKGQIKLRILDQRGNEVTVIKIVEVVQCLNSLKFSNKSSTISVVGSDGAPSSVTNRCADVTSECCRLMNVTPSVLNNVIFCHQENAAWPFEEGKKLKEKFDEIFDAEKYNKCTDALRKILTVKEGNIKLLEKDVGHRKEKKDEVEKNKRKLQDKEDKLESLENEIDKNRAGLNPIRQKIEEICELENNLAQLQRQLATKEETKKGVIEQQNNIRLNIQSEFEGTDEELQEKIKSFEHDRQKTEGDIDRLEKKKRDIEETTKKVNQLIQEALHRIGQLNQEKAEHERRCLQLETLIQKAQLEFNTNLRYERDDLENTKAIINDFKNNLSSLETSLNNLIEKKESEERELQNKVDAAREDKIKIEQKITSKTKEMKDSQQKINKINNDLSSLRTNHDYLKIITTKLDNVEKTIVNLKDKFQETEESQKNEDYKKKIQNQEEELEHLEVDFRILQQNDITEGKIESEKCLIMTKQKEINRLKNKHSENLFALFSENKPENHFKEAVDRLQKQEEATVTRLMSEINSKQREVTISEAQHKNHTEKVTSCEKELATKQNKISQLCQGGKSFKETLDTSYQKKEKLQHDKGQFNSIKIIFEKFVRDFEKESPCCPVCDTNFSGRNDVVKKVIKSLKNKLENVPRQLSTVEEELKKEEETYSKLQQMKLVDEEIEIITNKQLPEMKKQLEEIDKKLKLETSNLDILKSKLTTPQKRVEICRNIISDMASLDHNHSDVVNSERTIKFLEQQLVQVASNKSKQEIETEIDEMKANISELRRKIDAQQKKINNHKDRVQQLTQERSGLLSQKMTLSESIQKAPALEEQKIELNEKITQLRDELDDLNTSLAFSDAELKGAIENKGNCTRRNKQEIQEERNKVLSQKNMVDEIEKLHKEIDNYLFNETDNKIVQKENELVELRAKETKLSDTRNTIIEMISKKKEDIAKEEINYRALQDNVLLRAKRKVEQALDIEIKNLRKRIGDYNYRSVFEEKQRLLSQKEEIERQINGITGQRNELKNQIDELKQELALPYNKNAFSDYMEKVYEFKIAKQVADDLSSYIVAQEKAIIEFHRSKMIQINKNIRELWRDIYRGNDIDYIEIKTEYASGKARKRAYNYKVVQIKKGIELDMRGRCSAGQKVLACLIIRMALAETLSSNCGILALDEPTTNLDRENILSLSDTLSRLVTSRQREKNFQLIIITHDEEFLTNLTRVQGITHYYRVSRNNDGFSVINKEFI